ncbi:hypothetical protein ACC734_38370, partial [Rhizobium ruizarguesonis]
PGFEKCGNDLLRHGLSNAEVRENVSLGKLSKIADQIQKSRLSKLALGGHHRRYLSITELRQPGDFRGKPQARRQKRLLGLVQFGL